jgi:hypothetical protein
VNFKNELERQTFEIAKRICSGAACIEHNKTLRIEDATSREVASFVGPPKKEVDVITAGFDANPDLKLLISCKDYATSKAEPSDVQEWAAVLRTMNKYSSGSKYLGLIVCPSGFTSGCEPWASSYNLGIIPPLKGKKLAFLAETCAEMFERVLTAFRKRLYFPHDDLLDAPQFYEFVYRLTEAFEGRDNLRSEYGDRYRLLDRGWISSFSEVVRTFMGKALQDIKVTTKGIYVKFSDDLSFRMIGSQIQFGRDDGTVEGTAVAIKCEKNFFPEPCSLSFLTALVLGQKMTSAGDWGERFELGLTDDLILAIEPERLQVYRTRNPVDENLL